jgi:hypothetical protein
MKSLNLQVTTFCEFSHQDILHQVNLTLKKIQQLRMKKNNLTKRILLKKKEIQVFYLCTKLMKKTVTMTLKILYKWMIVARMMMMMMKKKMTTISKLNIKFSNPNLKFFNNTMQKDRNIIHIFKKYYLRYE